MEIRLSMCPVILRISRDRAYVNGSGMLTNG